MSKRGSDGKFSPKAMSQGFGASKLHNAPTGTFEETIDWSKLTLGGQPIPENLTGLITYAQTDQGLEEAERAIEAKGGRARAIVTADRDDKKITRYRDELTSGVVSASTREELALDNYEGLTMVQDPLKHAMDQHLPKGHRGRFMSENVSKTQGLVRGVLEYTPVLVDDGKGGVERVRVGGMFLASVPEELASKAEHYYEEINRQKQVASEEKVREQADQVLAEGGMRDLAKRRRTLEDLGGLVIEDQEQGDADLAHEFAGAGGN